MTLRSEFSGRDAAAMAALALIWGFTFLFIKVAIEQLTPLWLVFVRTFTGFLVLAGFVAVKRTTLPRTGKAWLHLAVLAVPTNVIPWTLVAWAQQWVASGLTAVLYSLIPIMTLVVAALLSIERFTVGKLLGLITASAGAALIAGYDFGAPGHAGATATILLACAFLAGGAVYAKRYVTSNMAALPMATGQIGIATVISLALALIVDDVPPWSGLEPPVLGAALTLGVLGTGVAFVLYYELIDRVGATNATLVTYLTPVVGLLAGWLLLDEQLHLALVGGAILIIGGVWLAQRSPSHRTASAGWPTS